MSQQVSEPLTVFRICFASRYLFSVVGIDHQHFYLAFEHIEDRPPKHASPNVTKKVLDWEYTREILQSDLRTRLRGPLQTSPPRAALSHEGSRSQAPGALHVQDVPSQQHISGGDRHV